MKLINFCSVKESNKFLNLLKIIKLGNLKLDEIACEAYDTHYIYNRNAS